MVTIHNYIPSCIMHAHKVIKLGQGHMMMKVTENGSTILTTVSHNTVGKNCFFQKEVEIRQDGLVFAQISYNNFIYNLFGFRGVGR